MHVIRYTGTNAGPHVGPSVFNFFTRKPLRMWLIRIQGNDMQIKTGSSRVVFIFKNFVIKIPKFWRISRFALGIVENLTERYWYCADNTVKTMDINKYPLAPILYASSNGLIMIMQRADVVTEKSYKGMIPFDQARFVRDMEQLEAWVKGFDFKHDLRMGNIGYIGSKLVMVDYGFVRTTQFYDCPPYLRHTYDANGDRVTTHTVWWRVYRARCKVVDYVETVCVYAALYVCYLFVGLNSIGVPTEWFWNLFPTRRKYAKRD